MVFCSFCCGRRNRRMQRSISILVLGLDSAGKSSIIKRIQGEPVISVVPTVGFNSVVVPFSSKYQVKLHDLGGSENFRNIWKQYLGTAYGIIYVVDSKDFDRVEENRQVFEELLSDENMKYKPLLLLANKQDSEDAMDEVDIVERLNVHTLVNTFKCPTTIELCNTVEPSTKAKRGCRKGVPKKDGIQCGFRWLMKQIDVYYEDLEQRIAEIQEREQREYAMKREKWRREKRERDGSVEETDEENGDPFRSIDEILSSKNLTNGFKRMTEEPREETDVSNFQIKSSYENLQDKDENKKKPTKKRKKKVVPLNGDVSMDATQLPPLRVPARNVSMAWTEETQITPHEDTLSRASTIDDVEDIRPASAKSKESLNKEIMQQTR